MVEGSRRPQLSGPRPASHLADDQASARASGTIVEGDASIVEPEFGFERPDGVLRNDGSLLLISPPAGWG